MALTAHACIAARNSGCCRNTSTYRWEAKIRRATIAHLQGAGTGHLTVHCHMTMEPTFGRTGPCVVQRPPSFPRTASVLKCSLRHIMPSSVRSSMARRYRSVGCLASSSVVMSPTSFGKAVARSGQQKLSDVFVCIKHKCNICN